jgi:hypothetical protein
MMKAGVGRFGSWTMKVVRFWLPLARHEARNGGRGTGRQLVNESSCVAVPGKLGQLQEMHCKARLNTVSESDWSPLLTAASGITLQRRFRLRPL